MAQEQLPLLRIMAVVAVVGKTEGVVGQLLSPSIHKNKEEDQEKDQEAEEGRVKQGNAAHTSFE